MYGWRRFRVAALAIAIGVSFVLGISAAQSDGFPYDSELLLDVPPMPGSKRIPNMDIGANGVLALEMWCNRVEGRLIVAGNTVTIITGQPTSRTCSTERIRGDDELLRALNGVTNWQQEGNAVLFVGSKTLRFKVPTN